MSRKATICLLLAAFALMLAAGAQAYEVRLSGFPGITQVDCGRTCGGAGCQMCTKWFAGNTCPSNQWTVYYYCNSHNTEAWSIDPMGESWGIWNYTPNGCYYDAWRYTSKTGAIRGTTLTMDMYKEGVPVVIRNAGHWVVQRGFSSSRAVSGNYGFQGTLVYGVYINDPLYGCCSGCQICSWDGYFTSDNWATNYFNVCNAGSTWGGYRCSAERDILANLHHVETNTDSFSWY